MIKNHRSLRGGSQYNFEVALSQSQRLLAILKVRPFNTLEAYSIGIMSPSSRITELRRQGYNIETRKAKITTPNCVTRIAEYRLIPSSEQEDC